MEHSQFSFEQQAHAVIEAIGSHQWEEQHKAELRDAVATLQALADGKFIADGKFRVPDEGIQWQDNKCLRCGLQLVITAGGGS